MTAGSLGREDAIASVLTPATGNTARFGHADFIYRVDGNRITGLAMGAAIGELVYTDNYGADGNPTLGSGTQESGRRQIISGLGRALGSSDGNGSNAALYDTELTVSASGGGNPNLKQVDADNRATALQSAGRVGYIVLDARRPGEDNSLLRLAQGICTQDLADLDRTGGSFNGYVAGIAQLSAGQVSWMDLRGSDDFSLAIADGVVTATIAPRALDETPIGTFAVGGAAESAFVSKDRFIALTPAGSAANLAIASSDFLGPFQGGPGDPLAAFDAAVPEYARWGAFLGDLTPTPGRRSWRSPPGSPRREFPRQRCPIPDRQRTTGPCWGTWCRRVRKRRLTPRAEHSPTTGPSRTAREASLCSSTRATTRRRLRRLPTVSSSTGIAARGRGHACRIGDRRFRVTQSERRGICSSRHRRPIFGQRGRRIRGGGRVCRSRTVIVANNEVLMVVASGPEGCSFTELRDRLVRTLEQGGYLHQRSGRYVLGHQAAQLARKLNQALATENSPAPIRPTIACLAREAGESVKLGVPTPDGNKAAH